MATNRLESQQCNPYCWSKTLRHCISSLSKVQKVGQIATQTPLIHNVARAFNACTNLERDCDSMKPALRFPTPLVKTGAKDNLPDSCQGIFTLPLPPAIWCIKVLDRSREKWCYMDWAHAALGLAIYGFNFVQFAQGQASAWFGTEDFQWWHRKRPWTATHLHRAPHTVAPGRFLRWCASFRMASLSFLLIFFTTSTTFTLPAFTSSSEM